MIKIKKIRAFTTFEVIISILVFSFLLNIAFIKYRDFREKQAIEEAKTKIVETFYLSSINALNKKIVQTIELDLFDKKIIISDKNFNKIQTINLPKNLEYYHTFNSNKKFLKLSFTKNGNISNSFSIYIFNSSKKVRYKISFYGFDRSKFLKINNYRKKDNSEIYLANIYKYHESTNEDRDSFYKDWRKE